MRLGAKRMKLKIVLEPSEDGGYTVHVPSLPGCISEGDTIDEAIANIKEAIDLYLDVVDDDMIKEEGILVQELVV
jgi:predicted RNase H-like HicB family nuclease